MSVTWNSIMAELYFIDRLHRSNIKLSRWAYRTQKNWGRKYFCIFYSFELKLCRMVELCIPKNPMFLWRHFPAKRNVTALFTNMRILKFKSQLTIAFFAAVNHLNGPLRKQNFTLTGSKGQGLWFVIGGFRSVLCVSVFQGSLLVIVIMIDGSQKRNFEGGFEL